MSDVAIAIQEINQQTGPHCKLIAVSKTYTPERIMQAYDAGQRRFGENRVQELLNKKDELPKDIEWHLIGTLQTNKVKYIVPFISYIHSLDREDVIMAIEKEAAKVKRNIHCLLQLHVAKEETKHGFTEEELYTFFEKHPPVQFPHIQFCGVMGMATFTKDENQIREEFKKIKQIFDKIHIQFFPKSTHFKEISMGMSGDYPIAIEEGATLIRVGSKIFGKRETT